MDRTVTLSIIIPVFNEEAVILKTYYRLKEVMGGYGGHYELLFVDDGSTDNSIAILKELLQKDDMVKALIFSRNFGQQAALSAGIDYASGNAVVLIDADLQDPPEVIPKMIDKWKEGYEVVYAKRIKRKGENIFKRMAASLFYRLLNRLVDHKMPVDVGDFRLIDQKVCNAIKTLPERSRYVRGIMSWVGFRHAAVEYVRDERYAGTSKYYFKNRVQLAIDALLSFSYKPLTLLLYMGLMLLGVSLIFIIVALFENVSTQDNVPIWTFILILNLFFNSILLVALGIMSGYIARIHEESKGRPLYIIADKLGFYRE